MRQSFLLALFLTLLLASCGPHQPASVPTSTSIPTATPIAHAAEIRFALIGEPRDVNVWELFDESGASYEDYALRAEYWPRLYHLAPPEFTFQPLAADGMPSPIIQEGGFYSATVKLRPDLKWTDGSSFTAEDVAFTVDAALAFELGFDWGAYYSGSFLSRLEIVDASTVKFIFKQKPDVAVWQYGALQGPVVQKAYWELRTKEAANLLPDAALRAEVEEARGYLTKVQANVDNLAAQVNALRLSGQSNRKLEASLTGSQNELIFAQNTLDKLLEEYEGKIASARGALYTVDDAGEPTLGTWVPAGKQGDAWVNEANQNFPFIRPSFDRAVYLAFASQEGAFKALQNDKVDMILNRDGKLSSIPPDVDSIIPSLTGSASYLVFNTTDSKFADSALHKAIACMIWHPSRSLSAPRNAFVLQDNVFWHNPDAIAPCEDLVDEDMNITEERAVQFLKSAGYSWDIEPTSELPGSALIMPNGQPLSSIKVLSPFDDAEALDPLEAKVIAQSLRIIGISIIVEEGAPQDIRYEVFSSKKYDLAILSWRLGLYPGYLCEWFGAGGQFDYGSDRLQSECEALEFDSNLESARRHIFEIQSILVQDLPFIPLYADVRYDAYRNIRYPFESVLGGLGGLYGAPSHAIPVQ